MTQPYFDCPIRLNEYWYTKAQELRKSRKLTWVAILKIGILTLEENKDAQSRLS